MPDERASAAARVFVYGTLRSGFTNPGRDVLTHHGDLVGQGSVPGTLYDLGSFPAMVEPRRDDDCVIGEVYELSRSPATALERLDRYEGARGSNPLPYERRRLEVDLHDGPILEAWAYVWTEDPADAARVEGGDYVDWIDG